MEKKTAHFYNHRPADRETFAVDGRALRMAG